MSQIGFSEKTLGIIDFNRPGLGCRLWTRFRIMMIIHFTEDYYVSKLRFIYFPPRAPIQEVYAPGMSQADHTIQDLKRRGYRVIFPFCTRYPIQISLDIFKQNFETSAESTDQSMNHIPVVKIPFTALCYKDGRYLFFDTKDQTFSPVDPKELIDPEAGVYKHRILCYSPTAKHHSNIYCGELLPCKSEHCACRGMGFISKCIQCDVIYHTCPYGCEHISRVVTKKTDGFAYTHERINTHIKKSARHKDSGPFNYDGKWEYYPFTPEHPMTQSIVDKAKKVADTITEDTTYELHYYYPNRMNG